MNYPQPGWGNAYQPKPPNRWPVLGAVGVVLALTAAYFVFLGAFKTDREAERLEDLAQQSRAQLTQPQPAERAAPVVPQQIGPCTMYSATNVNSRPEGKTFEADLIDGRIEGFGLRPGRALVEGNSLVLSNMPSCSSADIRRSLTADSLALYVHVLCTANGFHEIRCDTPTQRGAVSIDLERGCQCTDRFSCTCPLP